MLGVGSECDLKMYVRNLVYPLALQICELQVQIFLNLNKLFHDVHVVSCALSAADVPCN